MRNVVLLLTALFGASMCLAQERPREGVARGTVITTGEDRVVIERLEAGGQMALEVGWVKNDAGKWVRNQHQLELIASLKQGDKIVARWKLGEGAHYMIQEMGKLGADGKPVRRVAATRNTPKETDLSYEVRHLKSEIAGLKKEIAELRELLQKVLERKNK